MHSRRATKIPDWGTARTVQPLGERTVRKIQRDISACDSDGRPCGLDVREPYLTWSEMEKDIQDRGEEKDPRFQLQGAWKEYLGEVDGFDVYAVDGEWIRNNLSVVFALGGHGLVHEFIPMNEVWAATHHTEEPQDPLSPEDFKLTVVHEITEHKHMQNGLPYFEAHALASQRESDAKKLWAHTASARRVLARYLKRAGWWAINPDPEAGGGISTPPVDKGGLLNAVPGVDPDDGALYNGDGPADIMDAALDDIGWEYWTTWNRPPAPREMDAVYQFCSRIHKDGDPEWILGKWIGEFAEWLGVEPKDLYLQKELRSLLHRFWRDKDKRPLLEPYRRALQALAKSIKEDRYVTNRPEEMALLDSLASLDRVHEDMFFGSGGEDREFAPPGTIPSSRVAAHEMTEEEARENLLEAIDEIANSWTDDPEQESCLEKVRGALHSVMVLLDGEHATLPGFDVTPRPHPEDAAWHRDRGENWWPSSGSLNQSMFLHDAWQDYMARQLTARWFRQAFNKFNAPEVLSQLLKALRAAGLDDVAHRLEQLRIPQIINDAWQKR